MTTIPHSYFEAALTNSQPLRAPAPQQQAVAPIATPSEYSAAAIDNLRAQFGALPENQQSHLVQDMAAQGISGTQGVARYLQNAMAAIPTGFDLGNAQAIQQQGFETGRSTINETDMARVLEQARNLATQMMAAGANDRAILQAVGNLPGANPETLAAAQAAAQQVVDSDKFNLFSTRNADAGTVAPAFGAVATIETAAVGNEQLQNVLTGHIARFDFTRDEELRRQSYRTQPGAVPAVPQLAFASVESNGLSESMLGDLAPTSGLPNLKGGPSRGGPDF